jgi:hypothetical protein
MESTVALKGLDPLYGKELIAELEAVLYLTEVIYPRVKCKQIE